QLAARSAADEEAGAIGAKHPALLYPEHCRRIVTWSTGDPDEGVAGYFEDVDARGRPGASHPRPRQQIGCRNAGRPAQQARRSKRDEPCHWSSALRCGSCRLLPRRQLRLRRDVLALLDPPALRGLYVNIFVVSAADDRIRLPLSLAEVQDERVCF